MLEIPVTSDPAQSFITQLGDVKYGILIQYNDRSGVWTMDILEAVTNLPIIQSLPLVLGQNLLEPYNFDMGNIIVFDTSSTSKDATADDLGIRVKVYWYTDAEIEAAPEPVVITRIVHA